MIEHTEVCQRDLHKFKKMEEELRKVKQYAKELEDEVKQLERLIYTLRYRLLQSLQYYLNFQER